MAKGESGGDRMYGFRCFNLTLVPGRAVVRYVQGSGGWQSWRAGQGTNQAGTGEQDEDAAAAYFSTKYIMCIINIFYIIF